MFTPGSYYYFGTTKKLLAAFGDIFNSIYIQRKDDDGTTLKDFRVPISFAPRHKFMSRLIEDYGKGSININTTLPRMSFDFDAPVMDAERMLSKYARCKTTTITDQIVQVMSPVPYTWEITLRLWTKNLDDALQVAEQILAACPPSLNVSIPEIPEIGLIGVVPVVLNDNAKIDEYEGDFTDFRLIEWEFQFSMASRLFQQLIYPTDPDNPDIPGMPHTSGIIKKVNVLLKDIKQEDYVYEESQVLVIPQDESFWDHPSEPTNVEITTEILEKDA